MSLEELYESTKSTKSDINEHIETLKNYADKVDHITEMGVRAISTTWAFMAGKPVKLVSYDLEDPQYYGGDLSQAIEIAKAENIDFQFVKADVLQVELEETDLLFIDTFHAYDQLTQELALHSPKVKQFIIMHDTVSFGTHDEPLTSLNTIRKMTQGCGLKPAIAQFLEANAEWELVEEFENNNGLTVLGRKQVEPVIPSPPPVVEEEEETGDGRQPTPEEEELIDVIVTEEILADNPELVGEVEVGETIGVPVKEDTEVPVVEEVEPVKEEVKTTKKGKKNASGTSKTVTPSGAEK